MAASSIVSIDTLEQTRMALQDNKKNLLSAVEEADTYLYLLEEEKSFAEEKVTASKLRLKKFKTLTKTVCDECWVILPALIVGGDLEGCARRHQQSRGSNNPICIHCGTEMLESHDENSNLSSKAGGRASTAGRTSSRIKSLNIVELPSTEITSTFLDGCKDARIQSKKILNGQRTKFRPYEQIVQECSTDDDLPPSLAAGETDISFSSSSSSDDSDHMATLMTNSALSKSRYLGAIRKQLEEAKQHLKSIEVAMEKWTRHKEQHEIELKRTQKSIETVVAKERVRLEGRLLTLGASLTKLKVGDDAKSVAKSVCGICWEPPTKKLVFQCGHQCCEVCGKHIKKCHICRKTIRQKIPLYDC